MSAPQEVVQAVMDEWQRRAHAQLRACMEDHARALANAAFAASLEWAADLMDSEQPCKSDESCEVCAFVHLLRSMARGESDA